MFRYCEGRCVLFILSIILLSSRVLALAVDCTKAVPGSPVSKNAVDPGFVGFSIEWTHVDDGLGPGPDAKNGTIFSSNPAVVEIFRTLSTAIGGYPGTLRIGGNSGTRLWWQGSILPRLQQSIWSVNAIELKILEEFAALTGYKLTLTVPMLSPDPAYAVEFLSQGITQYISKERICAIEVGNEPDHYEKNNRRPAGYAFADFMKEYTTAVNAITAAAASNNITFDYQGPAYAYPWSDAYLMPFITGQPGTKYISFHKYGQRGCSTLTNPDAVTPATLMADPTPAIYDWVSQAATLAAANNQLLVWGEGGSSSCNGTAGTSDVFAATIWTVDMLMDMATRDVKYASLSGAAQTFYAPYMYEAGQIVAKPPLYAMLFVNRALRGTGNIAFRAAMDVATGWPVTGDSIKAYGLNNTETGEMSVVIVHKDATATGTIPITVSFPGTSVGAGKACSGNKAMQGYVMRLEAAGGLQARTGITLNGQTYDGVTDGKIAGDFTEEILTPQQTADPQIWTVTVNVAQYSAVSVRFGCSAGPAPQVHTIPYTAPSNTTVTGQEPVNPMDPNLPGGTTAAADSDALRRQLKRKSAIIGIAVAAAVAGIITVICIVGCKAYRRRKHQQEEWAEKRSPGNMLFLERPWLKTNSELPFSSRQTRPVSGSTISSDASNFSPRFRDSSGSDPVN
ncbi:hypothetical protein DFS34DRAFT_589444 [Phlyctochytrium arcticum]|nr:hypothetical protein DFS34DRAFT_589444 [Phlyctochytrium arcticum]